jgi:hypothetical protein
MLLVVKFLFKNSSENFSPRPHVRSEQISGGHWQKRRKVGSIDAINTGEKSNNCFYMDLVKALYFYLFLGKNVLKIEAKTAKM